MELLLNRRKATEVNLVTRYLTREIESIRDGDVVLSRDEFDVEGVLTFRPVERSFHREALGLVRLTIASSSGIRHTIETTAEHPPYVIHRGWVPAGEISAGDLLDDATGESTILSTERTAHAQFTQVFNLQVAATHTYFVREAGSSAVPLWVHNASSNYIPDHFPEFGAEIDRRLPDRARIGSTHGVMDIDEETITLKSQIEGPGKRWYDPNRLPINQAATHVEGHAAGIMVDRGLNTATVTINNPAGPCPICLATVPDYLPQGSTLNVRWMDSNGIIRVTPIIGR